MEMVCSRGNIKRDAASIERFYEQVNEASSGQSVGVWLRMISSKDLHKGDVFGSEDYPPALAKSFVAQIIVITHPGQIATGYTPIISCHASNVACKLTRILRTIDKFSGKMLEEEPKFLKEGDAALVEFTPLKPLCV
jgi:elongation factor 1-alpha